MKKLFSKTNFVAIFIDIVAILCFFAPFLRVKGVVDTLNIKYISGFELITNIGLYGTKFHAGLDQFQMSYTVLGTLVFILAAIALNYLASKKKSLSGFAFLLEWAGAVLTYCICACGTWGFVISPSSWEVTVHIGSMVCASLLVISGFVSIGNALSKKEENKQ